MRWNEKQMAGGFPDNIDPTDEDELRDLISYKEVIRASDAELMELNKNQPIQKMSDFVRRLAEERREEIQRRERASADRQTGERI